MTPEPSRLRRISARVARAGLAAIAAWIVVAYVVLPAFWTHYEHHPALQNAPKTTVTAQGIPGDPLNVGLIGVEEQVIHAMVGSGWDPADPVTLASSLRIAGSVLLDRPYADAPVSDLFLFGRKQDLAFEKPAGSSADRRHHVRFWKSVEMGTDGKPLWIGAVTFDRSVGLSHRTLQITHHIGPDIDAERDGLIDDLSRSGWLATIYQVTGVGATVLGRNGGGDPYYTDGEVTIGVLAVSGRSGAEADRLANPTSVRLKEGLWSAIRPWLRSASGP